LSKGTKRDELRRSEAADLGHSRLRPSLWPPQLGRSSPATWRPWGGGRAAGAFIAVLISGALIDVARGGDLVECEPQRVPGDGRYSAYRIVDGRECWYPGRPGKPKNELFWDRAPSAHHLMDQPEAETEPFEPPLGAPPEQPETTEAMPEQ
jgi:hypothetical protein